MRVRVCLFYFLEFDQKNAPNNTKKNTERSGRSGNSVDPGKSMNPSIRNQTCTFHRNVAVSVGILWKVQVWLRIGVDRILHNNFTIPTELHHPRRDQQIMKFGNP